MNRSIDRYKNMGIKYAWVRDYLKFTDSFWGNNKLGSVMTTALKSFLSDAKMVDKKYQINEGNYYQFSLTRLLNHNIDSDGISPTEIFGLDRTKMEKILNGLTFNYPEFIDASFSLGLDNITLRSDKKSPDVLKLF